jgi:hypothetical protein
VKANGYLEIVEKCELFDYLLEQDREGKFTWVEYWIDDNYLYKAIFSTDDKSFLPLTYYITPLE